MKALTSFDHDEAIRKFAFGLNLRVLTESSGGEATSTSFIGFCNVPRPRFNGILLPKVLALLPNVEPNIVK